MNGSLEKLGQWDLNSDADFGLVGNSSSIILWFQAKSTLGRHLDTQAHDSHAPNSEVRSSRTENPNKGEIRWENG